MLGGIGDDDDADAFNDETFGDGGWDDPAPMGDISDLSAMTFNKADILQEAQKATGTDGADFAFPSLPMGDSLLGGTGKPAAPAGLMTPQMMMQSVADRSSVPSFSWMLSASPISLARGRALLSSLTHPLGALPNTCSLFWGLSRGTNLSFLARQQRGQSVVLLFCGTGPACDGRNAPWTRWRRGGGRGRGDARPGV
jgi:hypothetical protein